MLTIFFPNIQAVSLMLKPLVCSYRCEIKGEEVCKHVTSERERLTLYINMINSTTFSPFYMQLLHHIYFDNKLNAVWGVYF